VSAAAAAAPGPPSGFAVRVGQGFDVHPFSDDPGRPLVLGGVRFPGARGLAGHSDADVIAHAVTDALLGACGLGDIGQHFPDTDPAFAGADSLDLLGRAVADVRAAGWTPQNVDCTVVLEQPKLAPHRDAVQAGLAAVVGAPVTVKGKRPEGLGALGRAEGVACFAVALVTRSGPAAVDVVSAATTTGAARDAAAAATAAAAGAGPAGSVPAGPSTIDQERSTA
jgi:2-C-methyl-D-erythritol 2,4-cyclodiphosphate synthase